MSDFYEALRRQDRLSDAEAAKAASKEATRLQQAQRAVPIIQKGFAEVASYLATQNVPTFQYRHFKYDHRALRSHYLSPSPSGFIADVNLGRSAGRRRSRGAPGKAERNLLSLILLLPDGRLWRHSYDSIRVDQHIVEVTPDAVLGKTVLWVPRGHISLNPEGEVENSKYGTREVEMEPFTDYLAKLAQWMRDGTLYSEVCEHTA